MSNWNDSSEFLPPQGIVVETKIDDNGDIRNETDLVYSNGLWWFPGESMHVYYSPTHWRKKEEDRE